MLTPLVILMMLSFEVSYHASKLLTLDIPLQNLPNYLRVNSKSIGNSIYYRLEFIIIIVGISSSDGCPVVNWFLLTVEYHFTCRVFDTLNCLLSSIAHVSHYILPLKPWWLPCRCISYTVGIFASVWNIRCEPIFMTCENSETFWFFFLWLYFLWILSFLFVIWFCPFSPSTGSRISSSHNYL